MLCGTVPVFVPLAAIAKQRGDHLAAAGAFSRCCAHIEAIAPHSAYHVHWALDALRAAKLAAAPLTGYIGYARKVLDGHFGPGAFEALALEGKVLTDAEIR